MYVYVVKEQSGKELIRCRELENANLFVNAYFKRYYYGEAMCLLIERKKQKKGEDDE